MIVEAAKLAFGDSISVHVLSAIAAQLESDAEHLSRYLESAPDLVDLNDLAATKFPIVDVPDGVSHTDISRFFDVLYDEVSVSVSLDLPTTAPQGGAEP